MSRLTPEELAELQDPATWEDETEAVRPAVKSLRAIVSVAFSREDFENVADYAKRHGMKISEFIRQAALDRMTPQQGGGVVSVSGPVHTNHVAVAAPRPKVAVTTPEPAVSATT